MRHKFLVKFEQDWYPNTASSGSIFDEMRANGWVDGEYEYSTKDKYCGGKVYILTQNGHKYMSIATNEMRTWTYHTWGGRRRRRVVHRIMLRLNEEGARRIKEQLVEQEI